MPCEQVCPGVHQFQLQLRGGCIPGCPDLFQQSLGTGVHKLGAVTDRQAFLMGKTGDICRAICCIIMKVFLHNLVSAANAFSVKI